MIAIGGVAFLLLALGLFGLTRSDSPVEAANTTQQTAEQPAATQSTATQPATTQPAPATQPTTTAATEQKPQTVNPEDELQKLREKRMDAGQTASERSKVYQAIAKVERQYPRDYRFTYERAKLAANGSKATSRTEACGRICSRPAPGGSVRDTGIVAGPERLDRQPGCARAPTGRSTRPPTPAGSPAP